MTGTIFAVPAFALAAALVVASTAPAEAGLFRNKERQAAASGPAEVYMSPREARRIKRSINQPPMILNNRVYLGMEFEPPNSAFFGGNPMIGPSSW